MVPLNVPNLLTVVRILLVPVLVVALLEKTSGGDLLAAIVFAIASLTDAIDGWLARSRNWVTTFGKLMDPIADKLLIIAALVVLVSLGRLEAWVAMVIIAREFAVTVLRVAVGAGQGVVIPASPLGKLKTAFQVAMVIALIAVHGHPVWLQVLIYVTVFVTVLSGADYFFGVCASAGRWTRPRAARARRYVRVGSRNLIQPRAAAGLGAGGDSGLELAAHLAERPESLRDDVVLVDRLEVDLARRHERAVVELREPLDDAADHLAHAVLDEPRPAVGLLDDVRLVGALHQLVDLRRHRLLDDLEQHGGVDLVVAELGAPDVERAEPALVVGRDRHRLEDLLDLLVVEALVLQALARRVRRRAPARTGTR